MKFLIIILLTFLVSGAGSPVSVPAAKTQKSIFGNKRWAVASSTIQPALDVDMDGRPDTDLTILLPPCEKDDTEQYTEEGTIVTYRGRVKCEEDEEQEEETGTWSYDDASKTLVLDRYDSRKPVTAKVISASASEIVFTASHQSSAGKHTIRTVLKAKTE